jgi:hypothetical protein
MPKARAPAPIADPTSAAYQKLLALRCGIFFLATTTSLFKHHCIATYLRAWNPHLNMRSTSEETS